MNLFKKLLHIDSKDQANESIPDHFEETLSQYSIFPRFYYINGVKYDIDSAKSIDEIPLSKTEFIINDEIWSIDGILRSHVNRFFHKFPEDTRAACYKKIEQYSDSPYFSESPDEKNARLKQAVELAEEKEKLEKISPEDMNKFNLKQFIFNNIFYDHRMARMLIDKANQPTVLKDIEYVNTFIVQAIPLAKLAFNYKIPIDKISFVTQTINTPVDSCTQYYTFFECAPYTPTGKNSKYPLILHFATEKAYDLETNEKCTGEIYYLQNGSIGKARLICWIQSYLCVVNLGIIKNNLEIKSVETSNNGVKEILYKHS